MIDRLADVARSRAGVALIAAWACAEAVLLPIVPDVGLLLLVAAVPRATARLFPWLVVGALVGSAILMGLTLADPDRVRTLLVALPGIDASTFATVETDLAAHGPVAFAAVGPGVPLKVYTAVWVADGGSPVVLAGAVVLNRLTRIGPAVVVAAVVGSLAPGLLRRHGPLILAAYAVAWIALYLVLWGIV